MQPGRDAAIDESSPGIGLIGRLSLVFVCPLSGIAQSGLTPILPKISEHFVGQPDVDILVRLMVTGLMGAMVVGSLLAAILARRIAPRELLMGALGLFAVAGSAGYLLDNLYALVASRLLLGIATAICGVMTAAIITTQVAPPLRDRWLGFYVVTGTLGAVVFFPVIGLIAHHNWRGVFLIHLLALPLLLWIRFGVPAARSRPRSDGPRPAAVTGPFPFGLVLLGLCCGAVLTTCLAFMPFHLKSIGVDGPEKISSVIMASALMSGILSFFFGSIRARFSIQMIFVAGFLFDGAGTLIAVLSGTYVGALLGLGVFGIGVGLLAPNVFAASAAAASPERRATVIGYVRAGIYAGPLVAQLPLEPIAHSFGPSGALIALGSFALLMIFGVQFSRRALIPATA